MNKNIQKVLASIVSAFESGDVPDAVAVASFPIPDIPSAQWSLPTGPFNSCPEPQTLAGTANGRQLIGM